MLLPIICTEKKNSLPNQKPEKHCHITLPKLPVNLVADPLALQLKNHFIALDKQKDNSHVFWDRGRLKIPRESKIRLSLNLL